MPKISVIVPVYKTEDKLNRCIDSILNQTFTDFELILVDDGSPDNSGKICDEYALKDSRIIVIHKENGGQSSARNRGIDYVFKRGDSEYITFVDSDDYVHRQYLQLLYDGAVNHKVNIAICAVQRIIGSLDSDDTSVTNVKEVVFRPNYFFEDTGVSAWTVLSAPCNKIYAKSLFLNIRFPEGYVFEDEAIAYKLLFSNESAVWIPEPLYYYVQNDEGTMLSKASYFKIKCRIEALLGNCDFLFENNYYNTFSKYFCRTCQTIEDIYKNCKSDEEYYDMVSDYKKRIPLLLSKYKNALHLVQKYGYKKFLIGEAFRKEQFKSYVIMVRKERGFIYSLFWALCNYFKKV